jgi:hypothetical protein
VRDPNIAFRAEAIDPSKDFTLKGRAQHPIVFIIGFQNGFDGLGLISLQTPESVKLFKVDIF